MPLIATAKPLLHQAEVSLHLNMSRRPLEGQHTNPFRRSIIARSESPFDPGSVPTVGMTNFGNSSAPSLSTSSRHDLSNPFGEVLDPDFDLEDCEDEDLLEEPPAYNEVVSSPRTVEEKGRPRRSERSERGERAIADEKRRLDSGHRERRSRDDRPREERGGHPDEDRMEREHRRLIEREKYYRERRRELERRQNRTPEEQQRDKERRRRRREQKAREASEQGRGSSSSGTRSRSKSESVVKLDKKGRPLDTIDKMDVTGLFGPGAFHHDGPFDACNPHRNKKNNPRPPVAAFNIEGPNFSLIPSDVNEGRIRQEATVFGREFEDGPPEEEQPHQAVHGAYSMGLGTSTFMDGTPASKDAIQEAQQTDRLTRSLSRRNPSSGEPERTGLLGRVRSLRRPT